MSTEKLLVILGITGNQGGSVARTFLSDPDLKSQYRLRGITRDPSSPASQELAAQGVEIVKADVDDPQSLVQAFADANVIFSVTNFWIGFLDPKNLKKAEEQGKPIGQIAYEIEYAQGRNIADAAAKIPKLERFVVSMLSSPRKWSKGRFNELWHFESKADMITYIKTSHPDLAAKMSELNMGYFFNSWGIENLMAPKKASDGTLVLSMPAKGSTLCPFVDPKNDTGLFVQALLGLKPGIQLYGETSLMSWRQWTELWSKVLGRPIQYEEVSAEYCESHFAGQGFPTGFGTEIAEMLQWSEEPGYNGGDPACKRTEELGVQIAGLSSLEDFMAKADWSELGV